MKKVLFLTVAIIFFIGLVGSASAEIVRARASVILAGVTANPDDANDVTAIIFARSLTNLWFGTKVFTAKGAGSSNVYAGGLSALSMKAPVVLVIDSESLQAGGQVPIIVLYNEPPSTGTQSLEQTLENQQLNEAIDLLPESTDFE